MTWILLILYSKNSFRTVSALFRDQTVQHYLVKTCSDFPSVPCWRRWPTSRFSQSWPRDYWSGLRSLSHGRREGKGRSWDGLRECRSSSRGQQSCSSALSRDIIYIKIISFGFSSWSFILASTFNFNYIYPFWKLFPRVTFTYCACAGGPEHVLAYKHSLA